jgi:hypothetical protein
MLVRARATGLFGGAIFAEQLKKDADLDVLRMRGEFQAFLADIQKKAKLQ